MRLFKLVTILLFSILLIACTNKVSESTIRDELSIQPEISDSDSTAENNEFFTFLLRDFVSNLSYDYYFKLKEYVPPTFDNSADEEFYLDYVGSYLSSTYYDLENIKSISGWQNDGFGFTTENVFKIVYNSEKRRFEEAEQFDGSVIEDINNYSIPANYIRVSSPMDQLGIFKKVIEEKITNNKQFWSYFEHDNNRQIEIQQLLNSFFHAAKSNDISNLLNYVHFPFSIHIQGRQEVVENINTQIQDDPDSLLKLFCLQWEYSYFDEYRILYNIFRDVDITQYVSDINKYYVLEFDYLNSENTMKIVLIQQDNGFKLDSISADFCTR